MARMKVERLEVEGTVAELREIATMVNGGEAVAEPVPELPSPPPPEQDAERVEPPGPELEEPEPARPPEKPDAHASANVCKQCHMGFASKEHRRKCLGKTV